MLSSIPQSDRCPGLFHLGNLASRGRTPNVNSLGGANAGLADVWRTTHSRGQHGGNLVMGMQALLAVGSGPALLRSARARLKLMQKHTSPSITANKRAKDPPAVLSAVSGDLAAALPDSSTAMYDPLGFYNFEGQYIDQVISAFGVVSITRLRWYREAELMHGRIAMLINMHLLLKGTMQLSFLPDEHRDMMQLLQAVMLMEVYRGCRLFQQEHSIVGDLGIGSYQEHQEQENNEFKELQNARLAMLAFSALLSLQA